MCSAISLVVRGSVWILFLLVVAHPTTAQSRPPGNKCSLVPEVGMFLCARKNYEPTDVISEATNKPIDMRFALIHNKMYLTVPDTYWNSSYGAYKSFSVLESCVADIEDGFFDKLDKNSNKLKTITFSKVKCLQTLKTKSFEGIGGSLEKLSFDSMPDLNAIDEGFFDNLVALKRIHITNTNISSILENILKVLPNIDSLKIYNNKLTTLPVIPSDKLAIMEGIEAYGNPLHCVCLLMDFILMMTNNMKSQDYRCSTPSHLNGKRLLDVGNLCGVTTWSTKFENKISVEAHKPVPIKAHKSGAENISMGKFRIEIIIGIAIVLLIIIAAIIATVICKQKRKKSKKKVLYMSGSPSKILFQDPSYGEPFIQKHNQMV